MDASAPAAGAKGIAVTSPPSDDEPGASPPASAPPPGSTPAPGYPNRPGYGDPNQTPPPLPRQGQGQQSAPGYGVPPTGYPPAPGDAPPGPGGTPPHGPPGDNYAPMGPPGGYAPMPGPGGYDPQQPKGDPPGSVVLAQRLMFVRVALDLLGIVLLLALHHQLVRRITRHYPNDDAHRIHQLVNAATALGIIGALIGAAIYTWLAVKVGRGRNWARIVVWVFCGLGLVSALVSVASPTTLPLSRLLAVIGAILDVIIIVSLARRESSQYYC